MAELVRLVSKVASNIKAMNQGANSNSDLFSQQGAFLKLDRKSKQFITGYNLPFGITDEQVLNSKEGDPSYEYRPIVTERQALERALNTKLTGGLENDYLKDLYIITKKRGSVDVLFDLHNPEDLLKYRALIANGIAAESLESTRGSSRGEFSYYFHEPLKQEQRKKKLRKAKNRIKAKLSVNEENKVWMYAVAKKMDIPVGYDINVDSLYSLIDETVEKETVEAKIEQIETFVNLSLKDIDFYTVWLISILTLQITTNDGNQKVAEGVIIGASEAEAKDNLKTAKFKDVYVALREKAYKKLKIA